MTTPTPTPTLTLPFATAQRIAAGLLLGTSKDDTTPVLGGAQVTHDRIAATDRYIVAEARADDPEAFPHLTLDQREMHAAASGAALSTAFADGTPWRVARGIEDDDATPESEQAPDFIIPAEALTWATKITPASLRLGKALADQYLIRWTDDADKRTITAELLAPNGTTERSQAFDMLTGNFPPVHKITDSWTSATDAYTVGLPAKRVAAILSHIAKHDDSGRDAASALTLGDAASEHKMPPFVMTGAGMRFTVQPLALLG